MFFSGNTGLTPEHGEIRHRFGAFDVVLLEVGAFHESSGKSEANLAGFRAESNVRHVDPADRARVEHA